MARQATLRSAFNCGKNRFPIFGSLFSSPVSSPSIGIHSAYTQTSSLHTAGLTTVLNGLSKPFTFNVSELNSSSSFQYGASPVVMSAQLSTAEVTEGEGEAASSSSLEDSDSVDDADGRTTSPITIDMEVPPKKLQPGHATAEGTARFSERYMNVTGNGYFREFNAGSSIGGLYLPSLGLGEYRGKEIKAYNRQFKTLIEDSIIRGINFLDISHLMRSNHCERVIGHSLSSIIESKLAARDEIVVCTKGGMILREKANIKEYSEEYLKKFADQGLFKLDDVAGPQCMTPTFLSQQLEASRKNLGLETIDVYYIQNIECQMNKLRNEDKFYSMLKESFSFLETSCSENKINMYGFTSRSESFINPDADNYLSLEKIVQQAKEVGGENHHLKFVQLPINLSNTESIKEKSQTVNGELMTTVDAANKLGLYVVAQATDFFTKTYRGLPERLNYNPEIAGETSDAIKSLHFSRKINGVGTVLFTTRRPITSNVVLSSLSLDC